MIVRVSPRCVIPASTSSVKVVACSSAHLSTARSTFHEPGVAPDHPDQDTDDGTAQHEARQGHGE
jgi:hypothetical protein